MYAKERGLEDKMHAISRATSTEEVGNDIYYPMKEVLKNNDIYPERHYAQKITREEFNSADYIFYMDEENYFYLASMFGRSDKFIHLRKYMDEEDIYDPWWTGRFEKVFLKIKSGVISMLDRLEKREAL